MSNSAEVDLHEEEQQDLMREKMAKNLIKK